MTFAGWQTAPVVAIDDRNTVPRMLVAQAERLGHKPLFVFDSGGTLGYAGLAERAECAATRLTEELGVEPRSSAALYLPNGVDFVVSAFACLFGGIVDFPVNPEYRKGLLAHALDVSGAALLFTDAAGADALLDPQLEGCRGRLRVIVLCGASDDASVRDIARQFGHVGIVTLAELASPGRLNGRWRELRATDLASIRFTSGTTGKAKGIMHSHLHMLAKSMAINRVLDAEEHDVLYSPFPLHHNLSSINGLLGMLQVGGTMVSGERFSASRYWPAASEHGATLGQILAPMLPMLLAQPARPEDRDHRVRFLWTARSSRAFVERFGAQPVLAYALSEVGVIAYRRDGGDEGGTACGAPIAEMDVAIVDDADRPLPDGESGQIVVRPRHPHRMTLGYFADLPATVRALRNLWYHTGDAGHFGPEGELHFEGRLGDTIRRRGLNISSEQLEHEAAQHTALDACMALGVPSALGEQDVHLMVVFRDAGVTADAALQALIADLSSRLPRSYLPRYYEIVPSLPRTSTGKISREEARRQLRAQPVWDTERSGWLRPGASDNDAA